MVKSIRMSLFLIGPMVLLFLFNEMLSYSGVTDPDATVSEFASETIESFDNLNNLPVIEASPAKRSAPSRRPRPAGVPIAVRNVEAERARPWESGTELLDRLSHASNAVQQSR